MLDLNQLTKSDKYGLTAPALSVGVFGKQIYTRKGQRFLKPPYIMLYAPDNHPRRSSSIQSWSLPPRDLGPTAVCRSSYGRSSSSILFQAKVANGKKSSEKRAILVFNRCPSSLNLNLSPHALPYSSTTSFPKFLENIPSAMMVKAVFSIVQSGL